MFAIDQEPGSVVVHYKTEAGRYRAVGDYAICTVPFSVLRTIETVQPFSHDKRRAIRQPEGRVLFAGEHCSLYHAWIQGAPESGIRAARQIHEATDVSEGSGIPAE